MFSAITNFMRFLTVLRTLAKHNALFPLNIAGRTKPLALLGIIIANRKAEGRKGQRLARAFYELGAAFIKLGQALSTRPDLIGAEIASDLSKLNDSTPPFSTETAKKIIEKDLGKPLEEIFCSFNDKPSTSTSIAQVHMAETIERKKVAVKVLRPDLEKIFRQDLNLLYFFAKEMIRACPKLRRFRPIETIKAFEKTIIIEMDLRFEAADMTEISDNFAQAPEVDWYRTSKHVLTTQTIDGKSIYDREAIIAAGYNPPETVLPLIKKRHHSETIPEIFSHAQNASKLISGEDIELYPDTIRQLVDRNLTSGYFKQKTGFFAKLIWLIIFIALARYIWDIFAFYL
ncbi:MAG: hypothetical protein KAJ75_05405 [Alphaproteobacteria bacterium]|nr:hypothetical protein [Alphaproteobacteria bacterium]